VWSFYCSWMNTLGTMCCRHNASSDYYWGAHIQLPLQLFPTYIYDQSTQPPAPVSHCPHSVMQVIHCESCLPTTQGHFWSCNTNITLWTRILFVHYTLSEVPAAFPLPFLPNAGKILCQFTT
jgi:hypothetical protein